MKVLIVGGGGREHALAWKIAQSPEVEKIYCAPGNAGISRVAECVPIDSSDIPSLVEFATENDIGLTVVGPEAPLAAGIADAFEAADLRVFGPRKGAAAIEASKSFAKKIMNKYGIPTAKGRVFTDPAQARAYIKTLEPPIVVKADGLAAGKGVIVCRSVQEANSAIETIMVEKRFGDAGHSVIVEEFLEGEEASFIAITDGVNILPLPASQDHKAVFDNDEGPNTGGMGAYSPAPVVDAVMTEKIMETIMRPVVRALAAEGRPYRGVLYAGLMINRNKVNVVEFNCRFGDPETQPLMMRIKSDILPVLLAAADGDLSDLSIEIDERAAVCVVMAAEGYPGKYAKGMPIDGLNAVRRMKNVEVFHAGTAEKDGKVVTSGGRVLGVTALADTIEKAIERAYAAVGKISWEGEHHRTDIGHKALKRQGIAPMVLIIMGSDSDFGVMKEAAETLKSFDIPYELTVASAHRSPRRAAELAETARKKGIRVIIAGAGHAAHLAGVLAAHTICPVIGVPIDSSALLGFDSMVSTVQMPPGVPVATMAVGKSGAVNAAILAAQILALDDPDLQHRLEQKKVSMARAVEQKARLFSIR